METFFKRHFRRKPVAPGPGAADGCRRAAVMASKVRRRSSVGLPSATLAHRRRSSLQLPGPPPCPGRVGNAVPAGAGAGVRAGRRRSSTTTPGLNPRFAVNRRPSGKARTIDTHLLGPSMLLASLIRMTEEEELEEREREREREEEKEEEEGEDGQPKRHGDPTGAEPERAETSASGGSWSEASAHEEEEEQDEGEGRVSDLSVAVNVPLRRLHAKRFLRAPRCLRRASSHLLPVESVTLGRSVVGLRGNYRQISRRASSSRPPLPATSPWGLHRARTPSWGQVVPHHLRRSSLAIWQEALIDAHPSEWNRLLSY
uniref:Uncharacterized protein n=1 Tax=Callorhinchus milii TaxID=7868 RepID=A0A4W3GCX8_CALMI